MLVINRMRMMNPSSTILLLFLSWSLWHQCQPSNEINSINQCTNIETKDDDDATGDECITAPDDEDRSEEWKWNIDAKHRCNIPKMSIQQLFQRHPHGLPPLYHEPVILYYNAEQQQLQNQNGCIPVHFTYMSSYENITKSTFTDDFQVTLSSSNSFSAHRRTITLDQYLNETLSKKEILPTQLANETWYLFGETYSKDWTDVLQHYCLPPCQTCTDDLSALSFGIGGKGSGVQWHVHGPGFSESIHGNKHWVLYPPHQKPTYNPDFTSRHWMEEVYTSLPQSNLPFECTVLPGEMIYFPDGWYHATINLSTYTSFISTFTTEHGFN